MSTPEQFVKAAAKVGLDAATLPPRSPAEPQGVNVWKPGSAVIPDATVWWPRPGHPDDQITWGPNFDYTAHPDIPAKTLAERVKETLTS